MIFEHEDEKKVIAEVIHIILLHGGRGCLNAANFLEAQLKKTVPQPKVDFGSVNQVSDHDLKESENDSKSEERVPNRVTQNREKSGNV